MGIGKTTIIKDGLSQALKRPFNFITLGGASDASFWLVIVILMKGLDMEK